MSTPGRCPAPELDGAQQQHMVRRLHAWLQRAAAPAPVQLIETHISYVLVGPQWAWKLKKAVNLGFVDFSSRARRAHFCDEELRLNRRLAPALYLEVVAITGTPQQPQLAGTGAAIDHAVKMRAFDQEGLWDRLARRGALAAEAVDALAAQLARLHAEAATPPAGSRFGGVAHVREPVLDNLRVLAAHDPGGGSPPATAAGLAPALLDALQAWEAAEFARLSPWLPARLADGRIREGHGDLHLGNVAQIDGRCTVFDCIDFNDDLRWNDVVSDWVFMVMDLHHHGLGALAHRFVDRILEASGDHAGMRWLRYYGVYRALVRAKVAVLRAAQAPAGAALRTAAEGEARRLLRLAAAWARLPGPEGELPPPLALPPMVLITHGFSGSGKTTGSQVLLQEAGAVRLRADVERKRLFGLQPLARSASAPGGGLYTPQAHAATLQRLLQAAEPVLEGGHAVILDATFLRRDWRDAARALAARYQVPFRILHFDVDPVQMRQRVAARQALAADASEADPTVLQAQLESAEALGDDERAQVLACPAAEQPGSAAFVARWKALAAELHAHHGR